jgi:hypothetical protein
MTRATWLSWLSPFACGAVVALVVIVSRQDLAAARVIVVPTCTAADGTLRLADESVPCAPEERRIRIKVRVPDDPECKDDKQRLQKVERRLKDLEYRERMGTLRGRKVRAPFEVVTKNKKRLMRIEEQNVTFYNRTQKPVVRIQTDIYGGMLLTQTADGSREAILRAQWPQSQLLIKEKDKTRVDLGRREKGLYSLRVYGPSNKVVAGIGQAEAGSGIVLIGDAAGAAKVIIGLNTEVGAHLNVANGAGTFVGSMAAGKGAVLQVTDAAGNSMVEAGQVDDVGVVRTLPGNCHFGIGILGLVPNCIVGKSQ